MWGVLVTTQFENVIYGGDYPYTQTYIPGFTSKLAAESFSKNYGRIGDSMNCKNVNIQIFKLDGWDEDYE